MKKRFITTVLATAVLLLILEVALRITSESQLVHSFNTDEELYQYLLKAPMSSKEQENRFIRHNMYLLEKLENKEVITVGFLGTSRTKALKPNRFGFSNAFNSGSNSYNEITYGLILEAEVLKHYLPNLKKIYVESSLLLRRPSPPNYIVENEHLIYLPLLKNILDLRRSFPGFESFQSFVSAKPKRNFKPMILTERKRLTLAQLMGIGVKSTAVDLVSSKEIERLNPFGEYQQDFSFKNDSPSPAIGSTNLKVERIKKVSSYKPFDYLFEMLAAWSKSRGIEIVFYQPPVRSDLQQFQFKYGLSFHNDKLREMAERNAVKMINMNFKDNGFSEVWDIFSDEDHMATCKGNATLFSTIVNGEGESGRSGKYYVEVSMEDVEKEITRALKQFCE